MGLVLGLLQSDFSFRINSALFPLLPVLLGTTKVEKNRDLGAIASWGPTFRVSVDLIINAYGGHYENIFAFKRDNGRTNCCSNGDRVPALWSHPTHGLHIVTSANGHLHGFNYKGIQLGKKFNLVLEQAWINGEVHTLFNIQNTSAKVSLLLFYK